MEQELIIIGTFVGIILLTILFAYLVNRFFIRLIRKSTEDLYTDPTNYKFLRHAIVALIYVFGISIAIYSVPNLRTLASSLLAGAGILAVAVGFASQHALSNIIGWVFIIIFKPFRINDRITVQTRSGIVEDITLRHTVIRDFENKRIVIPNALISDEVIINSDLADSHICKFIDLSISYDSDVEMAKQIVANEIEGHSLNLDIRTVAEIKACTPRVIVRVLELGESGILIRGWAWAKNSSNGFEMQCDLLENIRAKFKQAGITIPYPHRTVLMKSEPTND